MSGRGLGTALVTGGTSGIGLAIARGLVARGFGVVVTGRTVPERGLGSGIRGIAIDHARPDAADAVVAELDALGDACAVDWEAEPLTALVNNVGRRHNDRIAELERDSLLETFALNTVSHMLLTRALAPRLGAAAGGRGAAGERRSTAIVNISSRLAAVGMPGVSGYAASKGALNAFTVAAAVELAPSGVRVNAVAPGMTRTPLIAAWLAEQPDPEAAEAEVSARVPLARLAQPEDIAGAAVFLASPESGYITGAVLPADGGYTAS
ncbi:SDR family oxidoreductase [Leucobacter allii]|uniref:SDR family NAD(P)-dependent oxidoreductase n=1 Tax=Leucobacter allii TaxID=2932247 RepID=UPI001FD03FDA|nr:SDR family oxidoreductase [Leucobacter allii]UOR01388.1 SDR family oxidoreductase [Leucobacter allii]